MKKITDIYNLDRNNVYLYIHNCASIALSVRVYICRFHRMIYVDGRDPDLNHALCDSRMYLFDYDGLEFKYYTTTSIYVDWTKYLFELTDEEVLEHFVLDLI